MTIDTHPALIAFDAALAEVGVRNVLLADQIRGAFVRQIAAQQGEALYDGLTLDQVKDRLAVLGADDLRGLVVSLMIQARIANRAYQRRSKAAQHGEAVALADDDDDDDRPTLRGCIEAIKQAHDESLEGEHASARVMLRDVVADLEQIATQPAAAPQPVAQTDVPPVLVRDLAEIIGASVPAVCAALLECGRSPRSTNMAVGGEEAVAVAKRLAAAPAGVAGQAVAYRYPYRFRDIGETGAYEIVAHDVAVVMRLPRGEPLYTAPPARQALTDEVLLQLNYPNGYDGGMLLVGCDEELVAYARAVIAEFCRINGIGIEAGKDGG